MTGPNFVFCLVIVFLTGESRGLLDDHCTDQSYYDELHYITTTKQCCKPKLQQVCEDKSEEVCKDLMEVHCEPEARVECQSQTALANGKKCEAEYKRYDYKDCSKKISTRVDCKQNSVDTCKPKLKIYPDGRAVLTDELTCTPLLYEDCVVVDDAVAGCSRAELEMVCSCDHVYEPVCAGGLLYDNLCLYDCAKKEAECADLQGIPALADIAECVDPATKGIVNREAIKLFKKTLLDIENELANFADSRSRRNGLGFTEDEFKLLNKIVEGKMYLEIECSNEDGQCDVVRLEVFIEESNEAFNVVKNAGRVTSGFMQHFEQERKKIDDIADEAIKVQEKTAVKRPPQENVPYVVTVLLELDGITLGRSASDSNRLDGLSRADSPSPTACTTPFHLKWTDFVEKDKVIVEQQSSCEVKSSVKCERVSVRKCTSLNWKECSLIPVEECQTVDVSQPNQDKIHQKKCLRTDSSSRRREAPQAGFAGQG